MDSAGKRPSFFGTFQARRRFAAWVQAVVILGLPFVRIDGESALRFDVPSLKLYFFGSVVWIDEAYFFLLVFLFFFVAVMLFTVLYGRIWCGWMCPQTVLSDFARSLENIAWRISRYRVLRQVLSQTLILVVSTLVAASLIWYFVSPYDMTAGIAHASLGPWTLGSLIFFTVLIYLDLAYVRQKFCGSLCPYARFQSAFFDDRTLTLAFDKSRSDDCGECGACMLHCPAGIDIRNGLQVECINCAECIDACSRQMVKRGKRSLVRYFRGLPGNAEAQGPRPRVIALSAVFALIAVLFAYQVYVRVPLDFWIFRDQPQSHQAASKGGSTLNAYSLVVENRSLKPNAFRLSIAGIANARLLMTRNPFLIPSNSVLKTQVYVLANRKDLTYRVTQLRFILQDVDTPEIRVEKEAPFVYPEKTDKGWEI